MHCKYTCMRQTGQSAIEKTKSNLRLLKSGGKNDADLYGIKCSAVPCSGVGSFLSHVRGPLSSGHSVKTVRDWEV